MWNCRKYFLASPPEAEFDIQELLTQSVNNDLRWAGEIPSHSIVAVHMLPNAYASAGSDRIGFNIIGVQLLVSPRQK